MNLVKILDMKTIIKFIICAIVFFYLTETILEWTAEEFGLIGESLFVGCAVIVICLFITMYVYQILSSILDKH